MEPQECTPLLARLLIWRRRGMVLASTAGSLMLRFKDSSSAQYSGTILLLLWLMFQTSGGHKIHTPRIPLHWYLPRRPILIVKILLQIF